MELPDYAILHRDIKTRDAQKILKNLANEMKEKMDIEEVKQYFYDFLDYIIKFGSEDLEKIIRDIVYSL